MKILITGGSGYFGRNLTRIFTDMGHTVYAPTRQELDMRYVSDLLTYRSRVKYDAIVHCAASGVFAKSSQSFEDIYSDNILMFETLMKAGGDGIPIILMGSGAEYDRREPIVKKREGDVFAEWPIDAYGLSKNIISRRIKTNMRVLRSFGCFNYDEHISRFIRQSLYRIKQGLPIAIPANRVMDFFYMDDMATVIEHCLTSKDYIPQYINLVYKDKYDLFTIAAAIYKHAGVENYHGFLAGGEMQPEYTGNGEILDNLKLPLIGLDEGIKRTCKALL